MSQSRLERIELDLLRVPLKTPYKLVFGNVEAFDTLLVTVTLADGRSRVGEATILTGYTEETLRTMLAGGAGDRIGIARHPMGDWSTATSRPGLSENPFTVTAFSTAMEMAAATPRSAEAASVPLLAIFNETEPACA